MSRREYAFLKSALVFTRMEGFEVTEQTALISMMKPS